MPKLAANLTLLYNEYDFIDRFAVAKRDGFQGVEFLFPYAYERERLIEALATHRLVQVLHNLPAGRWEEGERGIACLSDRIGEFQDGVGLAVEYAKALGCVQVNCLIGIPPPGANAERTHRTVIENLRFAARELKRAGIRLLIEPINTTEIPGFWLNHVDDAMSLIQDVGSNNLYVQYDLYHQQRTDGELAATFMRLKHRIAHVQVADNPGRHEPGTGEINYPFLFQLLDSEDYQNWVGCEYKPKGGTSVGLKWAQPYLHSAHADRQKEVSE